MNANELANLLEVDSWYKLVTREEIATMLRQQTDRIRNLEKTLGFKNSGYETINLTPQLDLTDEEMKDLIQEYWGDVHIVDPDGYLHEIAFIKAILKKAQEK